MILVGNKIDLIEERKITSQDMKFEKENHPNIFEVFESSALTGVGINLIFQKIAEKLIYQNIS